MDVTTFKVSQSEASSKLREYRGTGRESAEYERVRQAYEAAAKGGTLLVLSEVMRECPRDAKQRPKLAIARSDRLQVKYQVQAWHTSQAIVERFDTSVFQRSGRTARNSVITLPIAREVLDRMPRNANGYISLEGYAYVPLVPPNVAKGHDLTKRFTLWEVEQWSDTNLDVRPDRDPYLLEQIAPDLYTVVGEWDLTEIERAVMQSRRTPR